MLALCVAASMGENWAGGMVEMMEISRVVLMAAEMAELKVALTVDSTVGWKVDWTGGATAGRLGAKSAAAMEARLD